MNQATATTATFAKSNRKHALIIILGVVSAVVLPLAYILHGQHQLDAAEKACSAQHGYWQHNANPPSCLMMEE